MGESGTDARLPLITQRGSFKKVGDSRGGELPAFAAWKLIGLFGAFRNVQGLSNVVQL